MSRENQVQCKQRKTNLTKTGSPEQIQLFGNYRLTVVDVIFMACLIIVITTLATF
jgi:hypothetical protein